MPAYTRFAQSSIQAWLFCGLAAIFDALYVIFLYWLGKRLTRKENWIFHLTWLYVSAIILLGIITATIVERIALTLSFWSYSEGMLEVPLLCCRHFTTDSADRSTTCHLLACGTGDREPRHIWSVK